MLPLRVLQNGGRGRVRLLNASSTSCCNDLVSPSSTTQSTRLVSTANLSNVEGITRTFTSTTLASSDAGSDSSSNPGGMAGIPPPSFRPRRRTPPSIAKAALLQKNKRLPRFEPRKVPEDLEDLNNPHTAPNQSNDITKTTPSISESPIHHAPRRRYLNEPDAATAIRFFQNIQKEHGTISPDNVGLSAESMMKAADYLTADLGTTEDLVGQRRALNMGDTLGALTPQELKDLKTEMEDVIKDEHGKNWVDGKFWEVDEEEEEELRAQSEHINISGDYDEKAIDYNRKAHGPWSETIIRVDRVQKVQRGGTMVRYRALVIGGNLNGCAGFGVAKANTPQQATFEAARMARRNIFFIDRYEGAGLTFDLAGRHNSCKVALRSVDPHRGLTGHPLIVEILKYFGIADCSCKSHGNRNPYNVVRATFKAIMTHESIEDIALKRGKRLMPLERAKRLQI